MTKHRRKTKRIKLPTAKELNEKLEWATRIITLQQGEIDRIIKLNDKLTSTLDSLARKD